MTVSHFLNINTIFWIFTLCCGLEVFTRGGQCIMIKIQKWDFLLAGCRIVGKGEIIKGARVDTDFLTIMSVTTYLWKGLYISQGHVYTHFNTMIGALFAHSFIPQVFTKHLQHAGHLYKYWRCSSEQNKRNSLPSWTPPSMDHVGVQSVGSVIVATARAAQGSQNLGKALFSPRKCIPS